MHLDRKVVLAEHAPVVREVAGGDKGDKGVGMVDPQDSTAPVKGVQVQVAGPLVVVERCNEVNIGKSSRTPIIHERVRHNAQANSESSGTGAGPGRWLTPSIRHSFSVGGF
jgi:hypothetical protein